MCVHANAGVCIYMHVYYIHIYVCMWVACGRAHIGVSCAHTTYIAVCVLSL